jgi:hypothetical protein
MALSSTNFIVSYSNTDLALVFQNTLGQKLRGINVCRFLSNNTEGNTLWVLLEGNQKLSFDFDTATDAKIASTNLLNAINSLTPNCSANGSGGGNTPIANPVSLLLTEYKNLASNNNLVALQWYDVTDVSGTLGLGSGQVFRLLSLVTNDYKPQGIILGSTLYNQKIVLDLSLNKVSFINDIDNKIVEFLNSNIIFSDSNKVLAINSFGTVTNSNNLSITNSTVNLTDTTNTRLFNCNELYLSNANNCILENISGDLTTLTLNNVYINDSTSLGKQEKENLGITSKTLSAYENNIVQIATGTLSADITITLQNSIVQANSEFVVNISSALVFGSYKIVIKDNTSSITLLNVIAGDNGKTFNFKYDKSSGNYYILDISSSLISKIGLTITTDNQVSFPNVLVFSPSFPANSQFFVNGVKYSYGTLNDFYISGRDVIWTNKAFNLETTNNIEIYYW